MDCKKDCYSNLKIEKNVKEIGVVLLEEYWGQENFLILELELMVRQQV